MRWLALLPLLALCLAGSAGPAAAQTQSSSSYPDRPVKIVVPYIAGSAPDVAARQVADRLTAGLGQQFIVDNKPGASGNIGGEVAARAAPDGYTLLLMTGNHVINPYLYAKPGYSLKDFTPITVVTRLPSLMVVPPSSPARTVAEFVALAKAKPGKLNYGSGGIVSLVVRLAQQGSLRPLAVTSAKRSTAVPDVPTLLEALPNGFVQDSWLALAAPAGTPPALLDRLYATLKKASENQEFRTALSSDGSEVVFNTPAEFAAMLPDESRRYQDLIKLLDIKIE